MKRILMLAALVMLCVSAAHAQNAITLEQVAGTVDGNIEIGSTVNFQLRVQTASDLGLDKLAGTTIGFRLYSPQGASWTGTTGEFLDTWPPNGPTGFDFIREVRPWGADGIGADTIAFNNSSLTGTGAPENFNEVAWQINAEIPNDPSLNNQELCIDSCSFVGLANLNWLWNDGLGGEIFPTWAGEQCFTIVDPNAASGELIVSPDTLTYSAEEGSGDPAGQSFSVSEASGGNIAFTAGTDASWLAVAAQGSTTPADVNVDVITSGLAVGSYFDSVEVASGDADNSPVFAYVALEITAAPTLVFTPDTLFFTAEEGDENPANQDVQIDLSDNAVRAIQLDPQNARVAADPTNGATPLSSSIGVDITGLTPGTYTDSVLVSELIAPAKDAQTIEPAFFYVVTEITEFVPPFALEVDPTSLSFSAVEGDGVLPMQALAVSEAVDRAIDFAAGNAEAWLSLNVVGTETPGSVEATVDASGLTAGTYMDSIAISSTEADSIFVPVELTVTAAPEFVLSPDTLFFSGVMGGANPDNQTSDLSLTSGSTSFVATSLAAYVGVDPTSGTTPAMLTVSVDITGLAAGMYEDTILVSEQDETDKGDKAAVDTYLIVMTTIEMPQIGLVADPLTLNFAALEGDTETQSGMVTVTESGGAIVNFTASSVFGGAWLSFDTTGTTPDTVMVTVDPTSLEPGGAYHDSVRFVSEFDTDTATIAVTLVVSPLELVVEPALFEGSAFEGDTATIRRTLQVSESHDAAAGYTLSLIDGAAWLSLDRTTGTTGPVADPDSVTVTMDPTGLTVGNYIDTIVVALDGESDTVFVPVTLTIEEFICSELMLSDTLLSFSAFEGDTVSNPIALPVIVYGSEVLSFDFTADVEQGVDWVTLWLNGTNGTSVSGSNLDTIGVTVDPSSLSPGIHTASVAVMTESGNVCEPGLRTFDVSVVITRPSEDTVRVMNTPAVPGMSVMVPVEMTWSCPLGAVSAVMHYDDANLVIDSISFARSILEGVADTNRIIGLGSGVINVESVGAGGFAPTTGVWFDIFATVRCEAGPGFYPFTADSSEVIMVLDCDPEALEVPVYPTFETGGIVVDSVDNYVCGYVVDTAGNAIEGATVQLWGDFPVGMPIDEMMSTGIGSFAFSDFMTVPFSLYAYKDGYYPTLAEGLNYGDKGIMLVLTPLPELTSTSEWVDYFCNTNTYRGQPLPIGSVVEAYANGMLVGRDVVETEGSYGFMPVYRDDFSTGEVDGAVTGDNIMFMINGQSAVADGMTEYPSDFQQVQVCLSAGDQVTQECELSEGWNLVSWRVQTESTDIMSVLGPYMDNIDVVLGFERGGLTYDPELPEFSTLWNTDHLSGYWIRVKEGMGFTLAINGTAVPVSTPIPVTSGWNLVSYLPEMPMDPADALMSIDGILLYAYGWDGGIETYQPGSEFSTLTEMMTCNGYWVKVSANGELVYPNGTGVTIANNVIPTRETAATATSGYVSDIEATTQWMNLYSRELTLDGKAVAAGSEIAAHRLDGSRVGSFVVQSTGQFGFMPVYGAVAGEAVGVKAGDEFYLTVNGQQTNETFTWSNNGDRLEIGNLSAASSGGDQDLPDSYALSQNYPNPFNPTTTISFTLPNAAQVKLEVYNILGKLVAKPFDGQASSGTTEVVWDGRDLHGETVSSGVYFYRLTTDTYTDTKKMMLLK